MTISNKHQNSCRPHLIENNFFVATNMLQILHEKECHNLIFKKKHQFKQEYIYIYICKLTKRRYQIELTLLLQLCDPFPPLCLILHKAKKSKFIQINLINSKHFSSSQYLLNKRIHDKKHLRFQCYVHLL